MSRHSSANVSTSALGNLSGAWTDAVLAGLTRVPAIDTATVGDVPMVNADKTGYVYGSVNASANVVTSDNPWNAAGNAVATVGAGRKLADVPAIGVSSDGLDLRTGNYVRLRDADSAEYMEMLGTNVTTAYTLKWPDAQGKNTSRLTNDGTGQLYWDTAEGVPFETVDLTGQPAYPASRGRTMVKSDGTGTATVYLPTTAGHTKGEMYHITKYAGSGALVIRVSEASTVNGTVVPNSHVLYSSTAKGSGLMLWLMDDASSIWVAQVRQANLS